MEFILNFIFYIAVLCLILIFSALDNNIDFDFWARLIVGKTYFQTGTLLSNDFYSYGITKEFIDHEWGSSLIFYLIQDKFGDTGIFIFKVLIIFLTFFILSKIIKLIDNNAKFHILFFFFIIQSVCYNIFSTIRCQTFTFLFFSLFLYILYFAKIKKNHRVLWTIPVLNIIWQNLHGGFVLGIALIAFFVIGEYLNKNKYKPYLITFLITLLTTLINPYGIKYLSYIVDAFKLHRTHIVEWQSAFFGHNDFSFALIKFKIFFFVFLILFLINLILKIKKSGFKNYFLTVDKTKYLIILFCAVIALKSSRCHVFFSYSVLALCYQDFYNIFSCKLPEIVDNSKEIILCILLFISSYSHIYEYKFLNKVLDSQYPIYCVDFIKENHIKGNVFSIFHTGSYVIYKLFPQNRIFMDGRYEEVYDTNLIDEMGNFFLSENPNEKNYKDFKNKYHTDIFIVDKIYPLYNAMKKDKDLILVQEDKYFALFIAKALYHKNFKPVYQDLNYYNLTKFQTNINF